MEIAERLRRARLEAGLTQVELARRTAIKQSVVSAYESGTRVPSEASCRRILEATGIRPSTLLERYRAEIRAALEQIGITDARVFGSAARGTDDPGSDLDLLVTFPAGTTLLDVVTIEETVEQVVGTDVDIVSVRGLDNTKPAHRAILEDAVAV